MSRNRSNSQSSTVLQTDQSWTSVVKGSKNNSQNKAECEVVSSLGNQKLELPLKWPTFQENGQRKYGPPHWWTGPPPPKGTEVFINHLHRQVLEDELCPILSTVGTIYTFRLMMDFSGSNRGYGFVQYSTREEAHRAIRDLNGYPVRPGSKMTVEESKDNCRLFIGHIPKELTESKLKVMLRKYMPGLTRVFLYMSHVNKKENRGFCFAEFEDHRSAAMGRRYLLCSGIPEWKNVEITVDWAVPETEVPQSVMDKVTAIYIRNLLITTSEAQIWKLLASVTINIKFVSKVRKVKDFAFIHFNNRDVAEYALKNLDGAIIDGMKISVSWAKPPSYKYNGEYFYDGNLNDSFTDSDSSGRRDSFGSTLDSSSSMLKGAPLFKQKDQLTKSRLSSPKETSPRFKKESIGSSSSSIVSHFGSCFYKDEGYMTDRSTSITPSPLFSPFSNVPTSVVAPTASYCTESEFPISNSWKYDSQDSLQQDSLGLNYSYDLHQYPQFDENSSNRISYLTPNDCFFFADPKFKVERKRPETETNEYLFMKELVSKMLLEYPDQAYEALKMIAQHFMWGTVFHVSLNDENGWFVTIRLKKGDVIKQLMVLGNPRDTEEDALNTAASKFFREYLLDPEMFRVSQVLFFP